jgi:hypothetical protein
MDPVPTILGKLRQAVKKRTTDIRMDSKVASTIQTLTSKPKPVWDWTLIKELTLFLNLLKHYKNFLTLGSVWTVQ